MTWLLWWVVWLVTLAWGMAPLQGPIAYEEGSNALLMWRLAGGGGLVLAERSSTDSGDVTIGDDLRMRDMWEALPRLMPTIDVPAFVAMRTAATAAGEGQVRPLADDSPPTVTSTGELCPGGRTCQLTEQEVRDVLAMSGWPDELLEQALSVAWGESRWNPYAMGDHGASRGLFQLNTATWAPYCDVDPDALFEPAVNAACAWLVYQYDLKRGQPPWWQWPWTR